MNKKRVRDDWHQATLLLAEAKRAARIEDSLGALDKKIGTHHLHVPITSIPKTIAKLFSVFLMLDWDPKSSTLSVNVLGYSTRQKH